MAIHVSVGELMSGQGVVLIKRNPWTNGKLLNIALKMGKKVQPFIQSNTVPWDKKKAGADWEKYLSPAQKKVIDTFRTVAEETRGMPLEERLKRISEALAGKSFGGTKTRRKKSVYAYQIL